MRSIVLSAATLLFALPAYSMSCDYNLTVLLGGTKTMKTHECWDLSKWPADKATSYCKMLGGTDADSDNTVDVKQVAACPAGAVAQCNGAKYQAMSADALPDAYLKQMPPEVVAQIKQGMEQAGAATKQYQGLETTVYYYPDPSGMTTLDTQKQDCVNGKKGTFVKP